MKVLIVGNGLAAAAHRSAYQSCDVEILPVTDERTDWRRHLAEADIVSICSPDKFHFEQAAECIRLKKAVLCEKPPCLRADELKFLTERSNDIQFACNLPLPWQPKFIEFGAAIQKLGKPYLIEAEYNYGRRSKLMEGWRADPEYSLLLGGGIHMMDLILWYMGERPNDGASFKLRTTRARYDIVQAIMKFPSGAIGRLGINGSYDGEHQHRVVFYGEGGGVTMENHDETDHKPAICAFVDMVRSSTPIDNSRLWHAMNVLLQIEAMP